MDERGGQPARVKGTGKDGDPGLLRIDFPGRGEDEVLESVSWEDFFDAFERNKLAFVYQEQTADGQESRFGKSFGVTAASAAQPALRVAREYAAGAEAFRARGPRR